MEGFMNPFDFGGGSFLPMAPQLAPGSMAPDLPSMLGQQLGAAGIRPQDFLQNPAVAKMAVPPPQTPVQNMWDPTPVATPGGSPMTISPAQQSLSTQTPENMAATDPMAASAAGTPADKSGDLAKKLQDGLRGVKAPPAPTAQTVRTPQAPAPHAPRAVQGGQLLALLQALGAGAKAPTNIPLPLKF